MRSTFLRVCTVFSLPLSVLRYIADPCTSMFMDLNFQLFFTQFDNKCSEHNVT